MFRVKLCALLGGAALAIGLSVDTASAQGLPPVHPYYWSQTTAPIFSNYYVPPHMCNGGVPAQLYVSPLPTPPMVGHTWVTNQAMMPHEYMYRHHRTYYKWHNRGGNFTRTKVWYW